MAKKLAYIVKYLRIYGTDFRNRSLYESALSADDQSDLVFRFVKGRCHGNQIILGEIVNAD